MLGAISIESCAQFDSTNQVQPIGPRWLHRLIVSSEGVVIGYRERLQTHGERSIHQLERSAAAVRLVGVSVKIDHSASFLNRSALAITETELNVIAALAIIGLSSTPKTG